MSDTRFQSYVIVLETGTYPIVVKPNEVPHITVRSEEERERFFYEMNRLCAKTTTQWIKLGCNT